MRSFVLLASVAMALAGGLAAPAAAGDREDCKYDVMRDAAVREQSIAACTRVIASGTVNGQDLARVHTTRAFLLYQSRDYDRALADANEVIGKILPPVDPKGESYNWGSAHFLRAISIAGKREWARAIPDYDLAIRLNPAHAAFHGRGRAYYETLDFDRAIADFTSAIEKDPKNTLSHVYRAGTYELMGELEKALVDARRSDELARAEGDPDKFPGELIKRIEQKMADTGPDAKPALKIPALTSHVMDEAGLLDSALRTKINAKLAALKAKTSDHMVFVTVKSLQGSSLANYTFRLAKQWSLGGDKKNGVILFIAVKESQMRFQVGYKLWPVLPDNTLMRIINTSILPRAAAGDVGGGIERGIDDVIQILASDAK